CRCLPCNVAIELPTYAQYPRSDSVLLCLHSCLLVLFFNATWARLFYRRQLLPAAIRRRAADLEYRDAALADCLSRETFANGVVLDVGAGRGSYDMCYFECGPLSVGFCGLEWVTWVFGRGK